MRNLGIRKGQLYLGPSVPAERCERICDEEFDFADTDGLFVNAVLGILNKILKICVALAPSASEGEGRSALQGSSQ